MTTSMATPADAPPAELTLTDDELEILLDDPGAEFVNGQVVEKPMSVLSGRVGSRLFGFLWSHASATASGEVYGADFGYRCFPNAPRQVRKPDVSFVAASRLSPGFLQRSYLPIAPDLAVEVVSPTDTYEALEEKIADYRAAGVKLIWVVNPSTQTVLIRRLDKTCAELDAAGTLDGESVVPGFACKVSELFA